MRIVTLDVEGTADAGGRSVSRFIGPTRQGYQYRVDSIQLDATASTALPIATLWRSASPGSGLMAREQDGKSGSFIGGAPSDVIGTGESWALEFTGATPGARCAATLTATEIEPE